MIEVIIINMDAANGWLVMDKTGAIFLFSEVPLYVAISDVEDEVDNPQPGNIISVAAEDLKPQDFSEVHEQLN